MWKAKKTRETIEDVPESLAVVYAIGFTKISLAM